MNWQSIHKAISSLTKQTSVIGLNEAAFKVISPLLDSLNYRLYYNYHGRSNQFQLIAQNSDAKPCDKEVKLIDELTDGKCHYGQYLDDDSQHYFFITNNQYCICLIVIDNQTLASDKQTSILPIINTLIEVWCNQLELLFYFQRDVLTGLFNPNVFVEAINHTSFEQVSDTSHTGPRIALERRGMAAKDCYAVALINIDNFAEVNERFGHTIGDEILIKLAHILQTSFRSSDLLCRYTGEEFAVLVQSPYEHTVQLILERLMEQIRTAHYPKVDNLTVTMGYTIALDGLLASELIDRARLSLQKGKAEGKDQIVAYSSFNDEETDKPFNQSLEIGEIELF
ncbi:hypothetical protein C2869_15305 [Saccharobesus litoralis]|uniref:diguanylate cyclase n=1 Tax=Saccharobesus litoralis TaxID=2172099 RepID=A0A2S0VU28_9ALTE|nr:GGDEF domain-containing protein [Saccharobesus litoralis]AWB67721.1 hypothetical protein C2869_15305 [Saccharobesus litoralis]